MGVNLPTNSEIPGFFREFGMETCGGIPLPAGKTQGGDLRHWAVIVATTY